MTHTTSPNNGDAERAALELAACPFCGGAAEISKTPNMWMVECNNAGCGSNPDALAVLKHDVIAAWNRRAPPALDAEGLPELPKPVRMSADQAYLGYTAEQVRQVARDARVDAEREIGLLKMVCEQLKARLASADALIESMATKADRAQIARTSAPEGASVGMVLVPVEPTDEMVVAFAETWFSKVRPIDDCGMEDCYAAMLAAAPTSASAQPQGENDE